MYSVDFPQFDFSELRKKFLKFRKKKTTRLIFIVAACSALCGTVFGVIGGGAVFYALGARANTIFHQQENSNSGISYVPQTTQEQKIIDAVKSVSPSVVSIIISKNVPVLEQYFTDPFQGLLGPDSPFQFQVPQYRQNGTQKQEIGGGSGFIVSQDGMIITNKHVALDDQAEYTVFTNDGKSYPAKVLAKDPVQDLAILKIDQEKIIDAKGSFMVKPFPFVKFGSSETIQIGQSVIAIGNALGEFRNTVSVGVVSGLGRTITASGGDNFSETIEGVIQTDAAINPGNSGGPLLNLAGEVIGINTATVTQAQSIGFAIPTTVAKRDIEQIKKQGKIVYPFLGVRYVLVTEKVKEDHKLSVDYGAFVSAGSNGETAVQPGSPAEKSGIKDGDVILSINGEKITADNSLGKVIQKYNPGQAVSLTILRDKKELTFSVTLTERSQ